MKTHDPPFLCEACRKSFRYKKDLTRHFESKKHLDVVDHGDDSQPGFRCPVDWCGRLFNRKDNMNRHLGTQHTMDQ